MDIHQLELFLAVMDSPSMTRAAEKVFLSPGAVSLQLHNLADELHTELFVRSGKRLIPTPAALRLAEHAKTLVELTHQIKQEFENDVVKDTRPFNFATGVTTLIYQLGSRFDLGLISLPVPEENLTIIPLFDEELLIVGPATNKSRRGHIGSIRPSDLARVPFLLYPRSTVLRVLIDRFFKDIGVTPRVVMEAEDTEAIKRLVESGFGYSLLPEHALRRRTRFFHAFRVDGHPVVRGLALAMVRTEYPRKLTVSIAEFLRSILAA